MRQRILRDFQRSFPTCLVTPGVRRLQEKLLGQLESELDATAQAGEAAGEAQQAERRRLQQWAVELARQVTQLWQALDGGAAAAAREWVVDCILQHADLLPAAERVRGTRRLRPTAHLKQRRPSFLRRWAESAASGAAAVLCRPHAELV
eukprot:scaffold6.g2609.t1